MARTLAGAAALGVCGLAVWILLYAMVLTGFQEHGSQNRLYQKFRVALAATTATYGGVIPNGAPVALMSSSAAGFDNLVVVAGTTAGDLSKGPGLQLDTPLIGQAGDSVVFGRSVTYGAPFRHIADLKKGARITVTTSQGTFVYSVIDVRYQGDKALPPVKVNQSRLTLVSSTSQGWRSGWAPDRIVFVDADLVKGQVQQVTPGLPSSVGSNSLAMQSNPGELSWFIGWLELLVVVVGGALWSWKNWGRRQTWLVGLPILIAVLWGTGNALLQFLPNLI
jgi:sortase A